MSSHHIIKDNQESALFLVDSLSIKRDVLESFFEWSPIIVTTEETFVELNDKGYKVDALICERGFKINFETELAMQQPIDLVTVNNANQIISEGIRYLVSKKAPAINVFINADHDSLLALAEDFPEQSIIFINQDRKMLLVKKEKYEKWLPANMRLMITPTVQNQKISISKNKGKTEDITLGEQKEIRMKKEGTVLLESKKNFIITEFI